MALPFDVPKALGEVMEFVGQILPSAEKRGEVLAKLAQVQSQAATQVLEYEARIMEAQAGIVEAEAKSENGLTRAWRPMLMLAFGGVVVWNMALAPALGAMFGTTLYVDAEAANLTPELWGLLKLGIGGYVIGRSGEKIVKSVSETVRIGPEALMKPKKWAKMQQRLGGGGE